MNIIFAKGDIGIIPNHIKSITTEEEIRRLFDPSLVHLIRLIQQNRVFENFIKKIRKLSLIPIEGYSIEQYNNLLRERNSVDGSKIGSTKWGRHVKSIGRFESLIEDYNVDHRIYQQFHHIVLANCILADKLIWISDLSDRGVYTKRLVISVGGKVSIEEIINYIKSNQQTIKSIVAKLPPIPDHYVSKRDWRIYELRKNNLKMKDIASQITNEFGIDNFDGKVNENSIKQAYNRLESKIKMAFKKSNKETSV